MKRQNSQNVVRQNPTTFWKSGIKNVYIGTMFAGRTSRLFLLAAFLWLGCASAWAFQNRVGGSGASAAGRLCQENSEALGNTTGFAGWGYKTASGRPQWLNRDPLGEEGGINLYTFVDNDPNDEVDPDGLYGNPIPGLINFDTTTGTGDVGRIGLFPNPNPTGVAVLQTGLSFVPFGNIAVGGSEIISDPKNPWGYASLIPGETVAKCVGKLGAKAAGIYEFTGKTGKSYVGQSGNISKRLEQHLGKGKLPEQNVPTVKTTEIPGGKTTREIAEQRRLDQLGGPGNTENVRNPIGPKRRHLLQE